jgi:hypothetical protein
VTLGEAAAWLSHDASNAPRMVCMLVYSTEVKLSWTVEPEEGRVRRSLQRNQRGRRETN